MLGKQESVLATEAAIRAKAPKEAAPEPTPEPPKEEAPKAEEPKPKEKAAPAPVDSDEGDEGETDEDSATPDGDDTAAPHPPRRRSRKRIKELTREKYEEQRGRERAEAEAAYWRQVAQQGQPAGQGQPVQQVQPAQPAQDDGRPTLEQYGHDWEAYEKAKDTWLIEKARQTWTAEQQQAEKQRQEKERKAQFDERIRALEAEVPGAWREAISAPIPWTPAMLQALGESEIGPRVAYYLSQHLDEANAITRHSDYAQQVAIARIEAKLLSAPQAAPKPLASITRAPAPPPVLQSSASGGVKPSQMGMEDHIAAVLEKRKKKFT